MGVTTKLSVTVFIQVLKYYGLKGNVFEETYMYRDNLILRNFSIILYIDISFDLILLSNKYSAKPYVVWRLSISSKH